jgi:hypothetical protein
MEIYKRKFIQETEGVDNAVVLSLWTATSCTKICGTHLTIIHQYEKLDEAERVRTAVTLWSSIWEGFGLNLGRDTSYPQFLSPFSSVPPGKDRDNTSITTRSLPSRSFKIHHSFIILPPYTT